MRNTPWFLMPFALLAHLVVGILRLALGIVGAVVKLTGRLVGTLVGLGLMIAGLVLTLTVAGAVVGIPLLFVGVMLTLRSLC
jgi:hypothetical protein